MAKSSTTAKILTIGSRGSHLALWQARYVAERLTKLGVESHIEIIKTTGDHLQTASLLQAGGKGLFTKEIEEALLNNAVDLAVHSLKDLPTENPEGLCIAAIPQRENPHDALVGKTLDELTEGARVGTSSSRRAAQLRRLRPDLQIEPIRGNVDTRLRKLKEGQYDAIMLAAAGLRRLGLEHEIAQVFSPEEICPAPGQGALAIQTRKGSEARDICAMLDDDATHQCVTCERTILSRLDAGCQLPVGAFAEVRGSDLHMQAVVISPDGRNCLKGQGEGPRSHPEELGHKVAEDLLLRGAKSILTIGSE
jgi:hydroxymethylbilane synthase